MLRQKKTPSSVKSNKATTSRVTRTKATASSNTSVLTMANMSTSSNITSSSPAMKNVRINASSTSGSQRIVSSPSSNAPTATTRRTFTSTSQSTSMKPFAVASQLPSFNMAITSSAPLSSPLMSMSSPMASIKTPKMMASQPTFFTPQRFMSKKKGGDKGGKEKGGKNKGGSSSDGDSGAEFSKEPFIEKMENCVTGFTNELNNIKVGRATPEMLHDIFIDYQMKKVPLKSLAQIYTKPPASLIVSLHEHTDLLDKTVCTAIANAGMDLAPISETVHGMPAIVVPFPKPTRELRDQLIKQTKAKAEETRINIRHVRKLWNDGIKKAKLPKDDAHRAETECQKFTDKYCDEVTQLANKKEKEVDSA